MSASTAVFPRVCESKPSRVSLINGIKDLFTDYLKLIKLIRVRNIEAQTLLLRKYKIKDDETDSIEKLIAALNAQSRVVQQRWGEFDRSKSVDIATHLTTLNIFVVCMQQLKTSKVDMSLYDVINEQYIAAFGKSINIGAKEGRKTKAMIVELAKHGCRNTVAQLYNAFMPICTIPPAMLSHSVIAVKPNPVLEARARLYHLFSDIRSMVEIPSGKLQKDFSQYHMKRKLELWDTDYSIKQEIIGAFKNYFAALKLRLGIEEYTIFSSIIDKLLSQLNDYFSDAKSFDKKSNAVKIFRRDMSAQCHAHQLSLICYFKSQQLSKAEKEFLGLTHCLPEAEIADIIEEPSYQEAPISPVVEEAKKPSVFSDVKRAAPQRNVGPSTLEIGKLLDAATSARIRGKRPHPDSEPSTLAKKLRTDQSTSTVISQHAEHKAQTASSASQTVLDILHNENSRVFIDIASTSSHNVYVGSPLLATQDPGDIDGFRVAQEFLPSSPTSPTSLSSHDDMTDSFSSDNFNFDINYFDSMSVEDDKYQSVLCNRC